jgi:hypothetical protein
MAIALGAAGVGWWYRYSSTRQAAEYWGPDLTKLIRDAPIVYFVEITPSGSPQRDVTHARGLTHLRNALLEDRSFDWKTSISPEWPLDDYWTYALEFRDKPLQRDPPLILYFSSDLNFVIARNRSSAQKRSISCRPISDGLAKMFAELKSAG